MRGCYVIKNPAGTFHFAGRVPTALAFDCTDAEVLEAALHSGPGLARKIAARKGVKFETLTWVTREEALEAAKSAFVEVVE
jgi:hypothetical protein